MHVRRVFAELDPTQSNEDDPELRAGAGRRTEYVFQEQSKLELACRARVRFSDAVVKQADLLLCMRVREEKLHGIDSGDIGG